MFRVKKKRKKKKKEKSAVNWETVALFPPFFVLRGKENRDILFLITGICMENGLTINVACMVGVKKLFVCLFFRNEILLLMHYYTWQNKIF